MIYSEVKFAYRHKPTNKWVFMEVDVRYSKNIVDWRLETTLHYLEEFGTGVLYASKNLIEEDLFNSEYGRDNFLEFELVEIEINYKEKT